MKTILNIIIFIIFTTLLFYILGASKLSSHSLIFNKVSNDHNLPKGVLEAICRTESGLLSYAYNPADPSGGAFGICQLLPPTAWQFHKPDINCSTKFFKRNDYVNNIKENCILFDSYTNITIAAVFFKIQLKRHRYNIDASIAAYNTGTAKICKNNWTYNWINGKRIKYEPIKCKYNNNKYVNQYYVNKVKRFIK